MIKKIKQIQDLRIPTIKMPKQLNLPVNPKLVSDVLFHKNKRVQLFLELSLNRRLELLRSLTNSVKRDILMHVPETDVAEILQTVDPDEATDILQLLTRAKREKVLLLVSQGLRDSISTLLEFDAETAAGLMTLDYIQVTNTDNIATVAKKFKLHEKRTGRPPVILVIDQDNKLMGYLPGHELGFARKTDVIDRYVKKMITISYAATHDEVMDKFVSHPHSKIAVMNDSKQVMGIIYSDDILRLLQETESSSLYDFAGISEEENVADTARSKVKNRHRWLIINLGTAFLASFVVSRFETTLSTFVILAAYMPIVAGMGGNAATQTLAVLVRGISLRQ
ncbi:magnesium transporter, partial [Candidatus Saccharibacteria bacterium]|nr:magnesium transporter [Candidatus Saccharibacteria bacterium]